MTNNAQIYCNPLPIPSIPIGRNAYDKNYHGPWWREFGDPTVIKFKGRWYLFPSCGMVWYSDDMINWEHKEINLYDVGWAPSVVERNGVLYLTASWEGSRIWTTDDPLGFWECLGPVRDHQGEEVKWADPMLFVDDDGTLYSYFSVGQNKGVFGVRMDDDDATRFAVEATRFFSFEPKHKWERFGECNQDSSISHLEGAFMTKHQGRYYLQYSAAGAQWRNYAVGCYVGEEPLGPFKYQRKNPILIQRNGLINGCGHHAIVEGPDGNLWCFYTILMRRFRGLERRIAMDPARFDENGEMFIDGPSERPRYLDGSVSDDYQSLSICQPVEASSAKEGREAEYAIDNYIRTWWEAESNNCPQYLLVDLSAVFMIRAARIIFQERITPHNPALAVYRFVIESSLDKESWTVLRDCRESDFDGHIRFERFTETAAKYVRITIHGTPGEQPPGIIDFSIFGSEK